MSRVVIEKACCNGRMVKLVHDDDAGDYYIREPDRKEAADCESFDTEAGAKVYYDEAVKRWLKEPNWEAQARYDEAQGTDNGYAPWDRPREY